ncbi:unnamed protein product [Owenia fusiformis]|uniref:Uncharacterized protein n=1 Tax=Owenia fusiformis TaxID=6347 RepID=A0A8J1XXZ9_OWEFU|nr:unnamed protein product [Owenia fusiformis]
MNESKDQHACINYGLPLFKYGPADTKPSEPWREEKKEALKSLVELCCIYITKDSTLTERSINYIPIDLHPRLMHAALTNGRDLVMNILMDNWKEPVLVLHRFGVINRWMAISVLAHFHKIIKEQLLNFPDHKSQLRFIDLSGAFLDVTALEHLKTLCRVTKKPKTPKPKKGSKRKYTFKITDKSWQDVKDGGINYGVRLDYDFGTADMNMRNIWVFGDLMKKCEQDETNFTIQLTRVILTGAVGAIGHLIVERLHTDYLKGISLRHDRMDDEDFVFLSKFMKCSNLTTLDLSYCGIRFDKMYKPERDFSVLDNEDLSPIEKLNLLKKPDERKLVALLNDVLEATPNLVALDLGNNTIRGHLKELTHMPRYLELLGLSNCQLINEDLDFLSQAAYTQNLKVIDLSTDRRFEGDTVQMYKKIFQVIGENLKQLVLSCPYLNTTIYSELFSALLPLKQLELLNMSGVRLSELEQECLHNKCRQLPHLKGTSNVLYDAPFMNETYEDDSQG